MTFNPQSQECLKIKTFLIKSFIFVRNMGLFFVLPVLFIYHVMPLTDSQASAFWWMSEIFSIVFTHRNLTDGNIILSVVFGVIVSGFLIALYSHGLAVFGWVI